MTQTAPGRERREVVGSFADRKHFEAAVQALQAAGFGHADLSVLECHDSIDAADPSRSPWRDLLTALVGEIRYEGPLVASGAILLAGGPVAAAIAAVIATAVGGIAVKEVLDEVSSSPHTDDFARALAKGDVMLWVSVADAAQEQAALNVLARHGAANIHVGKPGANQAAEPAPG
jgi:hypothetical protein